MKLLSSLPLAHLFFKHWHTDDTEVGVVVCKANFILDADGRLYDAPTPPELSLADQFVGDPALTSLVSEQEIAPFKPATDLCISGTAYAPDGVAAMDWPVAVAVRTPEGTDVLQWGFHVRGPTQWQRQRGGWQKTKSEAVTEVALDYRLAYGGSVLGDDGQPTDFFAENPAGIGFATTKALDGIDAWPAPQIGELGEFMAGGDPTQQMSVRGFGPIAKSWLPRRAVAGTFDDVWERTRHPRMPLDYDLGFWNAAPTPLQITPYLSGDEVIALSGMRADTAPLSFALPGFGVALHLSGDAVAHIGMTLDTVTIDTSGDPTVSLVWRALIPNPAAYTTATFEAFPITADTKT